MKKFRGINKQIVGQIAAIGLFFLVLCPAALGERYRWTGAVSSYYGDVGNWVLDNTSDPAPAIPTLYDTTMFYSNATVSFSQDVAKPSLSYWIAVRTNSSVANHVTFPTGHLTAGRLVVAGITDGIITVGKEAEMTLSTEFLVAQGTAEGKLFLEGGKINSSAHLNMGGRESWVEITEGGKLSLTNRNVYLANAENGRATLSLSGEGTVMTAQQILAANSKDSFAALTIADGAKVALTDQLLLACYATSSEGALATLHLSGEGSELKTAGRLGISSGLKTKAEVTVSDGALLECDHLLVGHMTNSTEGILNASGGAVIRTTNTTGLGFLVGNGANSRGIASFSGEGTLLETTSVVICHHSDVAGELHVLDGAVVQANNILVSHTNASQAGELWVENASLQLQNYLAVGYGIDTSATATFRNGASVDRTTYLGYGENSVGTLDLAGTVSTKNIFVGYGRNTSGTLNIHSGVLLAGTDSVESMGLENDILIGGNNSTGTVNVVESIVNSRYIILGGTAYDNYSTSGRATLNLVNSQTCGNTWVGSTGSLNFIGNSQYYHGVTGWSPRTFTLQGGALHFLATREGLGKFATTNFRVSDTSSIQLGIDHGVTLLNAGKDVRYELVTATGDFQWENATLSEGIWSVTVDSAAKTVAASLKEELQLDDYAMNSGWQTWEGKSQGWLELSGAFQQNYVLELAVTGAEGEDLQTFVEWMNEGYDAFSTTLTESGSLVLSSLEWSDRDSQIFAWDFTSYGASLELTGLRGYDIPEPSTWLLLLGMYSYLFFRFSIPLRRPLCRQ